MSQTTVDDRVPPEGRNRLIFEQSPYLLQHAGNPVDWYPWGDAAFARARLEDKPIFLSIGYSTCHWCHVMERESFENPDVARVLNELFVSIKVDREERPDVDDHYMSAVVAMTGAGGWPMSVFLDHDFKPFFGGTYFPPVDRHGRLGFVSILRQLGRLWKDDRERIIHAAGDLDRHLHEDDRPGARGRAEEKIDDETLEVAVTQFESRFDEAHGGFGGAPKFPPHLALDFLLRHDFRRPGGAARDMLVSTLDAMAAGGIHDQLGGGFHRYSTDGIWLVPHFEKMLYDNALLARVYLQASQAAGRGDFEQVGRGILDYVLREMTAPEGGFFSAQDADDPGGEGSFYVWNPEQLETILGREDAEIVAARFGVSKAGNFEVEGHGDEAPLSRRASILSVKESVPALAKRFCRDDSAIEAVLARSKEALFAARGVRSAPATDDKVLTDWNGLMISAFSVGFQVSRDPRYLGAARRAADFSLSTMRRGGDLLHRFRAGDGAIPGFLTDYAFLVQGLIDLHEASLESRFLVAAFELNREMVDKFWSGDNGILYLTTGPGEIGRRLREDHDGAVPSGASVAAMNLLRLGRLSTDDSLTALASRVVASLSTTWRKQPTALAGLLSAAEFAATPSCEVVLAGDRESAALDEMHRELFGRYLPSKVVTGSPAASELSKLVPMLEGKSVEDGAARAFVCRDSACRRPVDDPAGLRSELDSRVR